jgi:hypothetical protein
MEVFCLKPLRLNGDGAVVFKGKCGCCRMGGQGKPMPERKR